MWHEYGRNKEISREGSYSSTVRYKILKMKIGLTHRIFISILVATCLAILCIFLIMQWSINQGFIQYLNTIDQERIKQMADRLEEIYSEHKSWDFLREDPGRWMPRLMPEHDLPPPFKNFQEKGAFPPGPPPGGPGGHFVILDAGRTPLFGNLSGTSDVNFKSIVHNGKVVGYVGLLSPKHFLNPPQMEFLKRQKFALMLAASGVLLVVVAFSLPLANRLVRPIKAIAAATHDLASGKYAIRVPVLSSDELGQLSRDFNSMALTLEKNEGSRRQWVADISHELRTPLAVLQGEIEALIEGIRTISPQSIRSLHAEVMRLHRLVEDLYQLALSDLGTLTYRKENLNLAEILIDSIDSYRTEFQRKGITIDTDIAEAQEITVFADWARLSQLFGNLLDNSVKYTNTGGNLFIRLACRDNQAEVCFQDSAPGVPGDQLGRLFDRLYRAEESRNRASGGAGLGLAICSNIVEAHAGTIAAHTSPLGGVQIIVTLPLTRAGS